MRRVFQFFVGMLLAIYVTQTRAVQLDDFGDEFMGLGSHVSHHANNNLTKEERKLTKQIGLYSAVFTY
jgi:hypothetical protein